MGSCILNPQPEPPGNTAAPGWGGAAATSGGAPAGWGGRAAGVGGTPTSSAGGGWYSDADAGESADAGELDGG